VSDFIPKPPHPTYLLPPPRQVYAVPRVYVTKAEKRDFGASRARIEMAFRLAVDLYGGDRTKLALYKNTVTALTPHEKAVVGARFDRYLSEYDANLKIAEVREKELMAAYDAYDRISRAMDVRGGGETIIVSPIPRGTYTPETTSINVGDVWPSLRGANIKVVGEFGPISHGRLDSLATLPQPVLSALIAAGMTWYISDTVSAGQMTPVASAWANLMSRSRATVGPRDAEKIGGWYSRDLSTAYIGIDLEASKLGKYLRVNTMLHETGHAVFSILLDDAAKERLLQVYAALPQGILPPYFQTGASEDYDTGMNELFAESVATYTQGGFADVEALAGTEWARAWLLEWSFLERGRTR